MSYQPPYTITPQILQQVADIVELLTRREIAGDNKLSPQLRRNNRIRTIQASLAIENNTLKCLNNIAISAKIEISYGNVN
ncbi:MAG: hypothetical protein WCS87_11605 [Methylococcaceae bacterium]